MAFETLALSEDAGKKSLADVAYESIRDRLLMLDIKPGELLNDDALSKSLGVGRTPVREALKRLELDRLVVTYPRRGTFATRVDVTDLSFISEIRAQLEPLAASRAARLASAGVRAQLKAILAEVEAFDVSSAPVMETLQLDARVHQGIYAASANPHLEDILIRYDNLATRIWCMVVDRLPDLSGHVHEHLNLLRAVIDGDEEQAAELARVHVSGFERAVREALFSA
ncbi:GntR family transcriptional regulator [Pseudarthrobacter enclensis]|uniref:GntR family transcriptional regulator n=1 Tax=Pseudarthrobacter enclensis TaxID=993070 RepID=A0A0V8IPS5_9MICC|nr:GntR family transcriptional regulator [Pseudarthrobacter enclensis]KSU76754.1 GntR family transcriptional regulator [Pseudarthrobacter enclensis]BCW20687.1 GntR family transcriptional regulator [Arthrobacter sp. NtRootA9]SCC02093.1 DNA-binding transcriptional regulator, GntR family [Pseudarthrobacter enclensis]